MPIEIVNVFKTIGVDEQQAVILGDGEMLHLAWLGNVIKLSPIQ
ncbi:Uncharacterised protein [Shigella sonnei]|nr:Uncharacterised protein [Shigella sonnei]